MSCIMDDEVSMLDYDSESCSFSDGEPDDTLWTCATMPIEPAGGTAGGLAGVTDDLEEEASDDEIEEGEVKSPQRIADQTECLERDPRRWIVLDEEGSVANDGRAVDRTPVRDAKCLPGHGYPRQQERFNTASSSTTTVEGSSLRVTDNRRIRGRVDRVRSEVGRIETSRGDDDDRVRRTDAWGVEPRSGQRRRNFAGRYRAGPYRDGSRDGHWRGGRRGRNRYAQGWTNREGNDTRDDVRRVDGRSPLLRDSRPEKDKDLRDFLTRRAASRNGDGGPERHTSIDTATSAMAEPDGRKRQADAFRARLPTPIGSVAINEIFERSREILKEGFPNGGFRADSANPWSAVLSYGGTTHYSPDGRRVTWDTLMERGHELYRLFEVRPQATEAATALRDAVLRNESLLESLASADETFCWLKMQMMKDLRVRPSDPIVATAGAVLDTLAQKLGPFMQCYMSRTSVGSLNDLCRRCDPNDITCLPTFMFVMLGAIAKNAVLCKDDGILYKNIDPKNYLVSDYIPGACLSGMLEVIDAHRKHCDDNSCKLFSSYIMTPVYIHGKYFYCNEMF